jgi:hypothetical protein
MLMPRDWRMLMPRAGQAQMRTLQALHARALQTWWWGR